MKWIAHRGYTSLAPENTIPAFELAAKDTLCFGIECDVRTTKDLEFIVIHDENTHRVTRKNLVIKDSSYEALLNLDIKVGTKIRSYPNLKIPKLSDYLNICATYEKTAIIEIKEIHDIGLLIDMVDLIESFSVDYIIISSNINYLKYLRAITSVDLQLVCEKITDALMYDCRVNQIDFAIKKTIANEKTMKRLKKRGFKVNVWTISYLFEAKKMASLGIDYITSPKPLLK